MAVEDGNYIDFCTVTEYLEKSGHFRKLIVIYNFIAYIIYRFAMYNVAITAYFILSHKWSPLQAVTIHKLWLSPYDFKKLLTPSG